MAASRKQGGPRDNWVVFTSMQCTGSNPAGCLGLGNGAFSHRIPVLGMRGECTLILCRVMSDADSYSLTFFS